MISSNVRILAFALSLGAGVAGLSQASVAQGWNWGGQEVVASSGKESIRFNPSFKKGEIIVSFADRRLYLITAPGQALSYPIAIPREQSRWQGVMSITDKRENPSWTPTPEMRKENPKLPSWVPGGHPMNPLGVRGLYLGSSTYRIHGTDAPWTIGQDVSKGCIRMYNQDVIDLYDRVPVGTKVTVTWQNFTGGGKSQPVLQVAANTADDDWPTDQPRPRKAKVTTAAATTDDGATDQPKPRKTKATAAATTDDGATDQPKPRKAKATTETSESTTSSDAPKAKPRRVSETTKRPAVSETPAISDWFEN